MCAVSITRSSWVLHRPTACGLHCPFAAAAVTKSRNNLVPSPPSFPEVSKTNARTAIPYFVVKFCMRAWHADVYPELLQDTWEPGGHVQDGAARFVVLLHPVVELRVMALHVCVVPCLLDESAQCALDSRSAISQRERTRMQSHS